MTDSNGQEAGAAPWSMPINAQWSDMDQNGHMRTTAYLAHAENSRMQFFASAGYPMERFLRERIGPVIVRDELVYTAELRLLDAATLTLELAGRSEDCRRFLLRNTFVRADGRPAATVTSSGGWLDLSARRLTVPPAELAEILESLSPTSDFTRV